MTDEELDNEYFMWRDYNEHIENHTLYVLMAFVLIRENLVEERYITENQSYQIEKLVSQHDNSKYSKEEWLPYARRFCGPESSNPSPEVKSDFKQAVKIHKSRNLHHWESLKDYKGNNWKNYIVELVCDYIAMGWEFDNYICEYYDKVKEEIDLPKKYKDYLDSIINNIPSLCPYAEEPLSDKVKQLFWDTL